MAVQYHTLSNAELVRYAEQSPLCNTSPLFAELVARVADPRRAGEPPSARAPLNMSTAHVRNQPNT